MLNESSTAENKSLFPGGNSHVRALSQIEKS